MQSDPKLKRRYLEYNRRWFGGKLPVENVFLLWEPIEGCDGDAGQITDAGSGELTGDIFIRIDPIYRTSRVRWMILLHEMAHISVWPYPGHGKLWQTVMQDLAKRGAFNRLW